MKSWKRMAALSSAIVMAAATLTYFPSDTLQNIRLEISASAETTTEPQVWIEDNLTWTLDADGKLTISGTGAMKDYSSSEGNRSPAHNNSNVKKVVIEDGVTSIGNQAFPFCQKLASVTIPDSVTSIENYAFSECSSLTDIVIPNSVTSIGNSVFKRCSNLSNITLSNNITSIGSGAFTDCRSLPSITIPDSVTSIGGNAFSDCRSLTSITIPDKVTSIEYAAFDGCSRLTSITIPDSITSIGDFAFRYCKSLPSITIPDSVTSIGNSAFFDCSSLTSITIPDSVTSIGNSAFRYCSSLTNITIPDSVTSIGNSAFRYCKNLPSITIPDSVTSIGTEVFQECTSLQTISLSCKSTLKKSDFGEQADLVSSLHILKKTEATDATCTEDGNKEYWTCEHCGKYFLSDDADPETATAVEQSKTVIPAIQHKNAIIRDISEPNGTKPGYSGDRYCPDCNTVLEKGYTYWNEDNLIWRLYEDGTLNISGIGAMKNYDTYLNDDNRSPVDNNTKIKKVVIEKGVTSIGNYAFSRCWGLNSITIPDSVTSIGDYAFDSCINLKSITLPDSITSIGMWAFHNCLNVPSIIIPDGVTSIEDSTFDSCIKLTNITIPNSVTKIENSAFHNCAGLTSITIPDSVTSIGDSVFSDCNSLKTISLSCGSALKKSDFGEQANLVSYTNQHTLTKTAAKAETCTEDGNKEYWTCEHCGKYFLSDDTDPETATAVDQAETILPALNHKNATIRGAVEPTETEPGYSGDRYCPDCNTVEKGYTYWIEDNLIWKLYEDETLIISGTGAMKDYNSDDNRSPIYKNSYVEKIVIEYGVTSIGNYAFSACKSLTSITIPNSVTSIGKRVFSDCHSLTSITIPDNVTSIGDWAFSDCLNLTSVTIPDSVTSIGNYAFCECENLASITIPNNVTSIGDSVFENCTALTSITIPDSVTSIGGWAFAGCSSLTSITIPDNVTSIGDSAFFYCLNLTSIKIPDSVTCIENATFNNCHILTSITIPDNVTSIEDSAFYNCSSLTSITIPDSVTSIGKKAFNDCHSLTSVTIPDSVTSIGVLAFDNCSSLKAISLSCKSTLKRSDFGNQADLVSYTSHILKKTAAKAATCTEDGNKEYWTCEHCKKYFLSDDTNPETATAVELSETILPALEHKNTTIRGAVKPTETAPGYSGDRYCPDCDTVFEKGYTYWIEDNLTWKLYEDGTLNISGTGAMKDYDIDDNRSPAIQKKDSVKKVVIEDGVTRIGDFAFCECRNLTSITIPDSVTCIEYAAFSSCSSLTSITIPDGVTSIEDYAFSYCKNLTSITIPDSVTNIGYFAFYGCSSLTSITIPDSVTSIGYAAFEDCSSLTSITIPNSVTSIGDSAFEDCSSLTSITIPDSVTSIGKKAFNDCHSLTSVTIPDSVTSIGVLAFDNCSSLKIISLSCKSTLKRSDFGNQADLVSYTSHILKKTAAKAATCTEDGNKEYWTCEHCGKYFLSDDADPATATAVEQSETIISASHKLTKVEAKDATYAENGNKEYWTCEHCGKYFLSDDTNPETAKAVELSETVIPALVQIATVTTPIKCVYGQDIDEIDLRDYVKNTDVVGEVSVKIAAGSALPDGIKLDGSKLFGKPAKAYEDGKEVTFTFTAENGNTADLTLLFLVEKADPTIEVAVSGTHTEGDLVNELELILSENSTKGIVEIVSEIKALVAGKNTLTWKFTPEDENNYNMVTGTVVVNAQTTTTTTTTTKATTTTKPNTTTTSKTTATTKTNTTTTTKTTATTKPGTTTTTKATATTKPGTTTTSKITVTTNKTTSSTMTTKTTTMSSVTTTNTTAPSYGDINLDGKVDIVDAIFLNKYLATLIQFSDVQLANADCYQDGVLNDQDATALMQFIVLLIDDLPTQPDQK